jgi:hypothetical protein
VRARAREGPRRGDCRRARGRWGSRVFVLAAGQGHEPGGDRRGGRCRGRVYWGSLVKGQAYGLGDPPWDIPVRPRAPHRREGPQRYPSGRLGIVGPVGARFRRPAEVRALDHHPWRPRRLRKEVGDGRTRLGSPSSCAWTWEMNGTWYPWSEVRNGNGAGEFARAWRHVRELFVDAGATNANFVWCPNTVYSGGLSLDGLYPGMATSTGRVSTRTTGVPIRPAPTAGCRSATGWRRRTTRSSASRLASR